MPIVNFGSRLCDSGCGQLIDLDTWTGMFYRHGGPYPDEMYAYWTDPATGKVWVNSKDYELPEAFYSAAVEHCLVHHRDMLGG